MKTQKASFPAISVIILLAFAAPAFASWTHGQFSANTDARAGCHVAHAAQAPKPLKLGPTQTRFSYLCHGAAQYNLP